MSLDKTRRFIAFRQAELPRHSPLVYCREQRQINAVPKVGEGTIGMGGGYGHDHGPGLANEKAPDANMKGRRSASPRRQKQC